MNVTFIYDDGNQDGSKGGAELAMEEFAATCPAEVAFEDLPDADVVVIGNCVQFGPELIPSLMGRRVIRFHNDLARHEDPVLREWLDENAEHVFTSPIHEVRYKVSWTPQNKAKDHVLIPPCPCLSRFKPNREKRRHSKREGIVTFGAWQNPSKGGHLVSRMLAEQGSSADCYGPGAFPPVGDHIVQMGEIDPANLPAVLWDYERFVFLPLEVEPFGRCVVEAWAAGLEVITNDNVGAKWWIENDPNKLWSAADDFWGLIGG